MKKRIEKNEGTIDPILKKPKAITLSTEDGNNFYILSKKSEP